MGTSCSKRARTGSTQMVSWRSEDIDSVSLIGAIRTSMRFAAVRFRFRRACSVVGQAGADGQFSRCAFWCSPPHRRAPGGVTVRRDSDIGGESVRVVSRSSLAPWIAGGGVSVGRCPVLGGRSGILHRRGMGQHSGSRASTTRSVSARTAFRWAKPSFSAEPEGSGDSAERKRSGRSTAT